MQIEVDYDRVTFWKYTFFWKMAMKKYLHIVFLFTVIVLKVASASLHVYMEHSEDDTAGEKFCKLGRPLL